MFERRFRLCLVISRELCRLPPLRVIEESVRGGADLVQLREKGLPEREMRAWTEDALAACRALRTPLIVNDFVEIAAASGADGVHLGQQDLPPTEARRRLGTQALIGWSTRTLEQIEAAAGMREAVNYLGFGPAFATATKGYAAGVGVELLRAAGRRAAKLRLPILLIGGITPQNRAELGELEATSGLALSSALCAAERPAEVAAALLGLPTDSPPRTLGRC